MKKILSKVHRFYLKVYIYTIFWENYNFANISTLSSCASIFGMIFPHFWHSWTIIHPFFLYSFERGFMIQKHCESLSQGKSLSKCFEYKQNGQWFLALPLGCLATSLWQFSQRNDSFLIINHIYYLVIM